MAGQTPVVGMCQEHVLGSGRRMGSYPCGNKAKATFDGIPVCGVHLNQRIKSAQYGQEVALERPVGEIRNAKRRMAERRAKIAAALLDAVERGTPAETAFATARDALNASIQVYTDDVHGILDDIDAALAKNAAAAYPMSDTAPAVRDLLALRDELRQEVD